MKNTKYFVLVHGLGHGAWCWYKLVPLLRSSGHRVKALDLGSCGVNPKRVDEVTSFNEYAQPLIEFMASLQPDERVVLVGHSFGGFVISFALETYPEKIEVAIYLTAMMPSYTTPPASLILQSLNTNRDENTADNEVFFRNGAENLPTSCKFGPNYLKTHLYQHCDEQDIELARMLVRENRLFIDDLSKESMLTIGRFGSVNRVFVVCEDDLVVKEEFQRWMIKNSPPKQVKMIAGADHMVMISQPIELSMLLQEIVKH